MPDNIGSCMKKILSISVFLAFLHTSACFADSARDEYDNFVTRYSEYSAATKECADSIGEKDTGKIVTSEILFSNPNATNKFSLLANPNKLSGSQKEALKEYLTDLQMCRNKTAEMIARLPAITANIIISYRNDSDIVYIQLLTDKITIGEANIKKSDLFTKFSSDLARANNDYIRALNDRNNADADRRQRAAAILVPYLQNNKPYQVPMPQVQQPIIRPSINTNCTTYGNQINCTSQ